MSANNGIVTHGGETHEVNQYYDSVVVQLPGTGHTKTTKYCFLSKVDPWPDENNPPVPTLDQIALKKTYKNMFVIKRVLPSDMRPMTDRFDWKTGVVFDQYRDDIDMNQRDANGRLIKKYYAKNLYDQVFKCLWNNNGVVSTDMPYFQPGYMSSNNIYTGADGYKWVYLYTIDASSKQKFLMEDWMPTPLANTAGIGVTTVNSGNVPIVGVINKGSGYFASNTTIKITGASSKTATAIPTIVSGQIQDIVVTDPGLNYISANVEIISPTGSGASAVAYVSPVGGHGTDPFEEFGTAHIIVTSTFTQDEAGVVPTDIDYRQIDRKSTRLNSSHIPLSRMPSSA